MHHVKPLTRVRVSLGGMITEMAGGRQECWSKSSAMRPSAMTTSLQPDTAGQKDAFIEPVMEEKAVSFIVSRPSFKAKYGSGLSSLSKRLNLF